MKLNVGCGRNVLEGWINLDSAPLTGVDIVADLENCKNTPISLADDTCDEFLLSHLIEHIQQPLPMMQELWRIAKNNAMMTVRVPYGSSDDAWEDPTHVRPYFLQSFGYFSQPYYWRADYGYRGDWQCEQIVLLIKQSDSVGLTANDLLIKVMKERNVVQEMVATLRCVKPIRAPLKDLQEAPKISISLLV